MKNNFPKNRYKHCHNVGKKMAEYAKNILKKDDNYCNEMFVLGVMHDIGYELNPDPFLHDEIMFETLGNSYKYSNEIKYHSKYQDIYDTPEMRLLYFADMTVDSEGNYCTTEERLLDIEKRHGLTSEVYKESKIIADKIKEWNM